MRRKVTLLVIVFKLKVGHCAWKINFAFNATPSNDSSFDIHLSAIETPEIISNANRATDVHDGSITDVLCESRDGNGTDDKVQNCEPAEIASPPAAIGEFDTDDHYDLYDDDDANESIEILNTALAVGKHNDGITDAADHVDLCESTSGNGGDKDLLTSLETSAVSLSSEDASEYNNSTTDSRNLVDSCISSSDDINASEHNNSTTDHADPCESSSDDDADDRLEKCKPQSFVQSS